METAPRAFLLAIVELPAEMDRANFSLELGSVLRLLVQ